VGQEGRAGAGVPPSLTRLLGWQKKFYPALKRFMRLTRISKTQVSTSFSKAKLVYFGD